MAALLVGPAGQGHHHPIPTVNKFESLFSLLHIFPPPSYIPSPRKQQPTRDLVVRLLRSTSMNNTIAYDEMEPNCLKHLPRQSITLLFLYEGWTH